MKFKRGDKVKFVMRTHGQEIDIVGEIVSFALIDEEIDAAIVRIARGVGRMLPRPPGRNPSKNVGVFPLTKLVAA